MSPSFNFEKYNAFGWVLHRKSLEQGETFRVTIPAEYLPENGHNISLWTKGLVTGFDSISNSTVDPKLPGSSILDKKVVRAADVVFTAQEHSEFWCINYIANRKEVPKVKVFAIPAGTSLLVDKGSRVLFCEGTFLVRDIKCSGPKTVYFQNDSAAVTAESNTYGFIFEKDR